MAISTIDARGDQVNLFMIQGNTFELSITVQDAGGSIIDLTGYSARAQFRKSYAAAGSPVIDLTIANGGVVISAPASGVVVLNIIPATTTSIRFDNESPDELELVYDVELTDTGTGTVFKPCYGTLTIQRESTRG